MRILEYFLPTKRSAATAKDRLQIVIARERAQVSAQDYLPSLQKDLIDVIRKYVTVEDGQVQLQVDHVDGCDVLEINVQLPPPRRSMARI
ncbi:MAG: cell division topological specificity factor MinE [Candidatus Schekmanbacteria bacterium]|nr:cell division topological specificity factor MinE [Candidatus Schekmanbacteria bacterium]